MKKDKRLYPKAGTKLKATVTLGSGVEVVIHWIAPKLKAWRRLAYMRSSFLEAVVEDAIASASVQLQELHEQVAPWIFSIEGLVDEDDDEIETGRDALERCHRVDFFAESYEAIVTGTPLGPQEKKASNVPPESSGMEAESAPSNGTTGESPQIPTPPKQIKDEAESTRDTADAAGEV